MGDRSKSLSLSWREPPLITLSPWDCALSTGLPAVCLRTGRPSTPWLSTSWLTDLQGMRSNPAIADSRLNVEPSHCLSWKEQGNVVKKYYRWQSASRLFTYSVQVANSPMNLVANCLSSAQGRCPLTASQSTVPQQFSCHADTWQPLTGRTAGKRKVIFSSALTVVINN